MLASLVKEHNGYCILKIHFASCSHIKHGPIDTCRLLFFIVISSECIIKNTDTTEANEVYYKHTFMIIIQTINTNLID